MPLSLRRGTVTAILERQEGLVADAGEPLAPRHDDAVGEEVDVGLDGDAVRCEGQVLHNAP